MNKIFAFFFTCLLTISVFGQTDTKDKDYNLNFENTVTNENLPENWFQWGSGYNLSTDTITSNSGNNSVLIQPSKNRTSNSFGCVAYKIPAIYEGEEIELRAYMKLQDVNDGPIGLVLRIDGPSSILQFDNMQEKNIQGTSDWILYSVKLPYPKNAKTIYIGALLSGTGQLWVDDFELLIDGKEIKKAKLKEQKKYLADNDNEFDDSSKIEAFTLSEEKISDLLLLGKIWGFLKYYHPLIAAGDFNWDYELFRVLPIIIDAKKSSERDDILSAWVKSLGEFEVTDNAKIKNSEVKIFPDLDWINNSNLSANLVTQLTKVKNAKRPKEHYYIGLGGVGNPEFKNEKTYSEMKYPDIGFRLLSLFRYWNIIQYYFPYKNLIEEDWKDVLSEFIPKYINTNDEIEYKLVVLELIARVHDTHANIWGREEVLNKYWGMNYAPVEITFVENKAVVTDFYEQVLGEKTSLQIGDVITKINNQSIDDMVKERLKYTPASNYPTQLRDIARKLLRTNDTILNIEFNRDGKSNLRKIKTYSTDKINIYKTYQTQDTCFKFINPDIGYFYLGSIKNKYLPEIMNKIQNTKGLIIDLRCYPSEFVVFSLGKYLFAENTAFVKFSNGSIASPGLFTMNDVLKIGEENKDFYKGKVVILINETTQSQAEYTSMAFRASPNSMVIGSTTAGADGNVSTFYLPGGIRTMISGIGVYYPDGTETQRIGIVSDIEIKPTIEGVKLKKDELLEKAIESIENEK